MSLSEAELLEDVRRRLFARVIEQEIAFFDAQRTGDLISRLSADTGVLQNAVTVNTTGVR